MCPLQKENEAACRDGRMPFIKDYRAALKGNLAAQRRVARAFSSGENKAVPKDKLEACAWRILIVTTNQKGVNGGDREAMYSDCALAKEADAKARSSQINRKILAGGEKDTPIDPDPWRPIPGLDGEAHPL